MRVTSVALVALMAVTSLSTRIVSAQSTQPTIFIQAEPGFQNSLAAAMLKKEVPVTVTTEQTKADYILEAAPVDSKEESGAGKIARCIFAYCAGINGNSEVSVKLVKDKNVVWAYQVRKGNAGPLGVQSLSEAIAKHLKNDYLKKQK